MRPDRRWNTTMARPRRPARARVRRTTSSVLHQIPRPQPLQFPSYRRGPAIIAPGIPVHVLICRRLVCGVDFVQKSIAAAECADFPTYGVANESHPQFISDTVTLRNIPRTLIISQEAYAGDVTSTILG